MKPFSRIREFHLADWFTLADLISFGVAMVLSETSGSLMTSRIRIPKP